MDECAFYCRIPSRLVGVLRHPSEVTDFFLKALSDPHTPTISRRCSYEGMYPSMEGRVVYIHADPPPPTTAAALFCPGPVALRGVLHREWAIREGSQPLHHQSAVLAGNRAVRRSQGDTLFQAGRLAGWLADRQ